MPLYDLSVTIGPGMPLLPGAEPPELDALKTIQGGHPRNVTAIRMGEHVGTHVDSPRHVSDQGRGIEAIPLELLWGEALLVDMEGVDLADAEDFERLKVPLGTERLLIRTSHSAVWAGVGEDRGDLHPTFTADAARWMLDRGVRLVGVDTGAVGRGPQGRTEVHEVLLNGGAIIAEALNLYDLSPGRYELACLPLKIEGADGGPARAVARGPMNQA